MKEEASRSGAKSRRRETGVNGSGRVRREKSWGARDPEAEDRKDPVLRFTAMTAVRRRGLSPVAYILPTII